MKRVLRSRSLPRWTFSRSISMAWYRETPNSSIIQEDKLLRDIFDDPHVWSAFNSNKTSPTGLFQIKDLSHPGGFKVLATRNLSRARQLVEEISAGKRNATLIRDVDRLSDTLCSVSDLSGFIRRTHPQVEWLAAANETFMEVVEYMNGLNQHQKLYELIATATPNSAEEKAVQSGLLHDFELSGMKLSEEARAKYLELSNAEIELEQEFSSTFKPAEEVVEFDKSELEGLSGATLFKVSAGRNTAAIPTTGDIPNLALQLCVNEETRRRIFEATRTAQQSHIDILEKFLSIRAELASLAGYKTYAELKLSDKMAKTPDAVMKFLYSLSEANRPWVQKEMAPFKEDKIQTEGNPYLNMWDRDFYARRYKRSHAHQRKLLEDPLVPYLSVGTVIRGLSRLFTRLYGIRFVPKETQLGEVWHPQVRRLDVFDENGQIGIIYCDLFHRAGQRDSPPAHYTIRCSRRVDPGEAEDALTRNGYQLPIIALKCDFKPNYQGIGFLIWSEVETLFHEMGHAMHSMIARTEFHNISGTRCPTDFVELPSVLMERFCYAPSVLPLFARHYITDEPLSLQLLYRHETDAFRAYAHQQQIVFSVLDMKYHSQTGPVDSTYIAHEVYRDYAPLPTISPYSRITPQANFTHLFSYGASYYSYLFDRAIASKIWKEVFEMDPLSREAGEKYIQEVLKWGGGRDGWECVAGILGRDDLRGGGDEAMEHVGEWGIERQVGGLN